MYGCELDYKESWALKNWCFWTVVLEKTLESPLDCKKIQPVHRKGNQPWDFFGWNDAEAETPILWPPDVKNWLIGKDPDAGKDWGQEEKGTAENEMVGWHHWLDGHEFEQDKTWGLGIDKESWCAAIHGVTKCRTRLSNWPELNSFAHSCNIPKGVWELFAPIAIINKTTKNVQNMFMIFPLPLPYSA